MVLENAMLWLFLAAVIVASLTFISIVVWSENRRKEREEFYRFEFRKRMIDSGKMDPAAFASLMHYEHELKQGQVRQKVLVAAFVILGVGVGVCVGFQFIAGAVWKLGLIPLSIGLSMLIYGLVFTSNAKPVAPPLAGPATHGESD